MILAREKFGGDTLRFVLLVKSRQQTPENTLWTRFSLQVEQQRVCVDCVDSVSSIGDVWFKLCPRVKGRDAAKSGMK
jgi:hypothetical protein